MPKRFNLDDAKRVSYLPGKSLSYNLLPYAKDNQTSAVIIISPLNSIIEEQAWMLKASFVLNEERDK